MLSVTSMPGKRRSTCPSIRSSRNTRRVAGGEQARQLRRHLDAGEAGLAVDRVPHPQPQVQRQARDVGEGQPRPHGEGREHGVDLAVEALVQGPALGRRQVVDAGDLDPRLRERRAQLLAPDAALLGREVRHPPRDAPQHVLPRQLVGGRGDAARLEGVLHGRHADHEELVQVAGEDGEELAPLEQRDLGVAREGQHPGVEVEPGELTVDVERRVGQVEPRPAPRGRSSSRAHDDPPRAPREVPARAGVTAPAAR